MNDYEDLSMFGPECKTCSTANSDDKDDPCDDCTNWIGKFSSKKDDNSLDDL